MDNRAPDDTGLRSLALVMALAGEALDLGQAARNHLAPGAVCNREDVLRIAKAEGYKARATRSSVTRIDALALPVIASHRDGTFFVIGRRTEAGVLVGVSGGAPVAWTLDELAANWTGDLVFVVRRDRATAPPSVASASPGSCRW